MKKSNYLTVLKSKTPKSYKSKKLNNANFGNFTHNDYQVFLHLVSKIGGVDEFGKYLQPEQLQREHILTAKEFSELFNTDIHHSYRVLKKAIDKLMKTDIKVERIELKEVWRINICSMAKYNSNKGYITIEFTDRIMPYLSQVKERFILYNLKEIANFGSLYTTRLYELLQEFKETGWMLKSVDQLREAFAVGNSFKLYGDFKKYTFAHACQEINDNYDMDLRFKEEKEGRRVVAVKFFFKKTFIHEVTNRKTGKTKNVYQKPKLLVNNKKGRVKKINSDILEGQTSFNDLKDKDMTSAKPIKNILEALSN
ncbi:MAG TPA: replication initiation protein [Candidatus Megaira endosymbiont of Stentor roeselii]|nr:replication initiation protein [Candidatus Megaera endosymbiont of Stentor roeselii]